jgi:hypothetical protein
MPILLIALIFGILAEAVSNVGRAVAGEGHDG